MTLCVDTLVVGPMFTNCYLVYERESRMGVVIDPGGEGERIVERISELKLQIDLVVNTHGHIDHILADYEVVEATGSGVAIHPADEFMFAVAWDQFIPDMDIDFKVPSKYILVDEGEYICCGGINLKIIYTPGHSPGGICLYRQGELFSGDTLFFEGVGRDDLPGGDWEELRRSVTEKLFRLPVDTKVYPGHGPPTTIGHEMANNPFFRVKD